MDDAPRHEFIARAEELCDALYGDVQELRRAAALAPRQRRALVDRAFRHAHTLKGTASALLQFAAVTRLAHELENLLEIFRASRRAPDEGALDACEDAVVALTRTVETVAREKDAPDASEIIARLQRFARDHQRLASQEESRQTVATRSAEPHASGDGSHTRDGGLVAGLDALLNADERRRISQVRAEGARLLLCEVAFSLSDFDEKFRQLIDAINTCCEIVATLPAPQNSVAPAQIGFRLICAADDPRDLSSTCQRFGARLVELTTAQGREGARRSNNIGDNSSRVASDGMANDDLTHDARRKNVPAVSASDGAPVGDHTDASPFDTAADGNVEPDKSADAAPSPFVRVHLSELDGLIAAAHELFDDTMRALATTHSQSAAQAPTFGPTAINDAAAPGEVSARVRRRLVELVERVVSLRMQPLARTLERAARAARVAARRGGKRVEIEIKGGESRVDRAVAERLASPLEHLLRNAVAHGIESPAERRKLGKDARGRVRVEAVAEGNRVRVTVSDDGRGVALESVARVARAQGILARDASLDEGQALRMIFRPGFSTAARISDEAGRGVGLDAVEQEIESAGGEVRVRTQQGRGTTFELRLPLALAVVPAVLVRAGDHTYALDARHVVETITRGNEITDGKILTTSGLRSENVEESRREDASAQPTTGWRGAHVPVVSLCALLGQDARAASHVVIALADEARPRTLFDADATRDIAGRDAAQESPDEEQESESPNESESKVENERVGDAREGAVERSPRLIALEVDQLLGQREVLVRSLGRHATRWRGISGAIDLRDGTIALALDLPRLLED